MDKKYPVTGGLVPTGETDEAQRIPTEEELIEVGQWYWVKDKRDSYNADFLNSNDEMLMCVTSLGTNYAAFKAPGGGTSYYTDRVHFNEFPEKCRREYDWESILSSRVAECRAHTKQLMLEVKEVTARLGVGQRTQLEAGGNASTALVAVSGAENVEEYKAALIKAEKEKLPALFKEIKESNELMAAWMKAEAIPLEAQASGMQDVVGHIHDRIFNVEIYAGLTEHEVLVRDGEPAPIGTKLRVMQRRHYMDEECLLNYRHGGMDFESIEGFDKWIAEEENMKRILPFERCMVAFRIRRNVKYRKGPDLHAYIKFWYEQNDKLTYMYVRNGEKLYRMSTALDFGDKIFPDTREFDPEALMVHSRGGRISSFMSLGDYEERKKREIETRKDHERIRKLHKEWCDANKDENDRIDYDNMPEELKKYGTIHCWRSNKFDFENYEPFSKENVYYDDMNKKLNDQLKEYNRISLVIQGLFDRSQVLHPHPPVQLWDMASFNQNIELVYDQDKALAPGEKPDIKAYIAKCNEHFKVGSMSIGQEDIWELKEGEKECARMDRSWRRSSRDYRPERCRPYGNPGPGYIGEVKKLTRTGKATFIWNRKRQTDGYIRGKGYQYVGDPIETKITVHVDELFCVDGYKPGDYKQFFEDPRTRAEYLEWAPMLLAAEEYHNGKLKPGESDGKAGFDTKYR